MRGAKRSSLWLQLVIAAFVLVFARPAVASDPGDIAVAQVSLTSYRHYLDDMLYTRTGDDRGYGPEHDLARDNIATIMTDLGLDVTLEPFIYSSTMFFNVVGTKWGTTTPGQEYVIGAHYDSVSNPGADDNASGVALVLEAARVLSNYDSQSTIRFIAFDREENGLIGSWNYVNDHWADNILGMISADMVSWNNGNNTVDIYGAAPSTPHKDALAAAVTAYGGGVTPHVGGYSGGSDHVYFESFGFQACLLIEQWGNPNYHTSMDTVDTPDYIDYNYAVNNTRSVVGFLVDNAGVIVTAVDGDFDADGDVDLFDFEELERCITGPGIPPADPACLFFDFNSDGDVDCGDASQFASAWTVPGAAPTAWQCALAPPTAETDCGRCFTLTPPPSTQPMALLVTGDPTDPAVACLNATYVQLDGTLGPNKVFQAWDAWAGVIVCDATILPETSYNVCCDFGQQGTPILSPPVGVESGMWGDTVGDFVGDVWSPPNSAVGILDVVAILDTFRADPTAPPMRWVDLIGVGADGMECAPDGIITMIDVVVALDAFAGILFADSTGCTGPCL